MSNLKTKKTIVEDLKEKFTKSSLAAIADYKGITVSEITDLRKRLKKDDAEFKIAKNTLTKRAIKETNLSELEKLLTGPSGILFGYGDPTRPIKTLVEFLKEIEKGDVKGGIFEGKLISKSEFKAIASLPSKDVLLGQIAGLMVANIRDIACIFESLIRDIALLIEEVAKKNEDKANLHL